jgi:hypothetical protein
MGRLLNLLDEFSIYKFPCVLTGTRRGFQRFAGKRDDRENSDKLRAIPLSGAVFALAPPLQMFCEIEHFLRN